MKIAEMLLQMRQGAAQWAGDYKGSAEVANDPVHLFALLAQSPGAVRVCLIFKEEVKRGEHEESGMVDRTFLAVVSRGRGFTVQPEDSLIKGSGGGPALFDLVEELRQVVRGFSFDSESTEVTPDFKRTEMFPLPEGFRAVDAYQIEFSIGVQLEAVLPRDLAANRDTVLAGSEDRVV